MLRKYEEQGGLCFYCRRPVRDPRVTAYAPGESQPADLATVDHRIPRSQLYGRHVPDNLVMACRGCNDLKGDCSEELFLCLLSFG